MNPFKPELKSLSAEVLIDLDKKIKGTATRWKDENRGKIALYEGDCGTYLIEDIDTAKTVLIQVDYDFPAVASVFGWVIRCNCPGDRRSRFTDGSIDCPYCGKTAGAFIAEAREYLDENIGLTASDPGYFAGE